jgi:hypothetical protein
MENGPHGNSNFCLFAAKGKRIRKISICLLQKEMEVCFPWSENDKCQSTIAVSANKPINGYWSLD